MTQKGAVPALLLVAALALAGCQRAEHDTRTLGGSGPPAASSAVPKPPAPASAQPIVVRLGEDAALAAWLQDEHVVAATWARTGGWSASQPLERIYGTASELQLASNGQGIAMAVWHHRVGNIHSLRFSRYDASGWSVPDVLPGALPRPAVAGAPSGQDAPQLYVDAEGNVLARWPSGFRANEMQVARYTAGAGWSHAASEPLASAPSASPAPPAASSAR